MGIRIVYEIIGEIGGKKAPICVLFSNSSHATQPAEKVFRDAASEAIGPTDLVERLLTVRYGTAEGNHRTGDRIFWLSDTPYGDYEFTIRAEFRDRFDVKKITRAA